MALVEPFRCHLIQMMKKQKLNGDRKTLVQKSLPARVLRTTLYSRAASPSGDARSPGFPAKGLHSFQHGEPSNFYHY